MRFEIGRRHRRLDRHHGYGGQHPYLEAHDTCRISDGGPDDPRWVIAAVCPNCHPRAHPGQDGAALNNELLPRLVVLEPA